MHGLRPFDKPHSTADHSMHPTHWQGHRLADICLRRRCWVVQGYALFRHMTVAENIIFGPRMRKLDMDFEAK